MKVTTKRTFGSGVCLDTPCLHVLTAYHVIHNAETIKVEGIKARIQHVDQRPDAFRGVELADGRIVRFDPAKDFAVLALTKPLRNFLSVEISSKAATVGQPVRMFARHGDMHDVEVGSITNTAVNLATRDGIADIGGILLNIKDRPGNSGGAILDDENRLIGLVTIRSTEGYALALPIRAVFPDGSIPPALGVVAEDAFRKINPLDSLPCIDGEDTFEQVQNLHQRTKQALESIRSITADEVLDFSDGSRYEFHIGVTGEKTTYTTLGGQPAEVPLPRRGVVSLYQWYDIVKTISRVPFEYRGTANYEGKRVRAFEVSAKPDDEIACEYRTGSTARNVACRNFLLTNLDYQPIRLIQEMPEQRLRIDVGFTALELPDKSVQVLPASIVSTLHTSIGRYSSTVAVSNYHVFRTDSTISFSE